MIFAAIVGAVLAASDVRTATAIFALSGFVLVKGLVEVGFRRGFISGAESPYQLYRQELERSGGGGTRPWIGYLLQMLFFGVAIGMLVYGIGRFVF